MTHANDHIRSPRDITKAQFDAALRRNGMHRAPLAGYICVSDYPETHVYAGNAGTRRRDQLAYLIEQQRLVVDAARD